jgi:hypothetical protein
MYLPLNVDSHGFTRPFEVETLTIILFRRFKEPVLEVALAA